MTMELTTNEIKTIKCNVGHYLLTFKWTSVNDNLNSVLIHACFSYQSNEPVFKFRDYDTNFASAQNFWTYLMQVIRMNEQKHVSIDELDTIIANSLDNENFY